MEREYVGIDLHRRRSVIVRMDANGEQLSSVRIDNDPGEFAAAVMAAPAGSDVILEATYGWYWAADLLRDLGYVVHLANPQGNDWGHRRVKNDERDAHDLADLLRLGRLAEAWIAPREIRELRELVRFRAKLSSMRTGVKAQAHAVLAKNGVLPVHHDMWGSGGTAQFDALEIPRAYSHRLEVLHDLVCFFNREILEIDRQTHLLLQNDPGYQAVQAIYGVGEVMAAIFVAEIGDVSRFGSPEALCSWAGSPPSIASPTPRSTAAGSPNKTPAWCAGRPSRPSPVTTAASSKPPSRRSPNGAARTRPRSPSPARSSRSSTTGSETERSAVSRAHERRDARTRTGASSSTARLPLGRVAQPAK